MVATQISHFLDVFDKLIASSELPFSQKNTSEVRSLQRVREYFTPVQNTENSVALSAVQQNKIVYIKARLQHMAANADCIQINQKQLKNLFELPSDTDIMLLLSTYYACFSLMATPSKPILTRKVQLINELLCSAYHDIICKLIENKMPHDEYFSDRIIMQIRTSKSSRGLATYNIIAKVAETYKLPIEEILGFIEDNIKNYGRVENWPIQYLHQYMNVKHQLENASFDDFLREMKLDKEFTADEMAKYDILFRSYITKLVTGQIGTFLSKKVAA
jgi:hypothetical protein